MRTKLLVLCVHYKIYPLYLPFWLLNRRDDSAGTRSMVLALSPCLFHVFFFFFKHMCMRVNLFNNGQNCSVGWSAGLFKWIVMLCNNLNNEVSLISKVRTKLLILWVHYKIYPL